MPNHVHLFLRPWSREGLSRALALTHRRYARRVNRRNNWTGAFWQARFHSNPCRGRQVLNVARYIAQNPLRKGLVRAVGEWRASSVRDLLGLEPDPWITSRELLGYMDHWGEFLNTIPPSAETELIREHSRTGECLSPDSGGAPRAEAA
jgi:hypothetical protein